MPFGWCFGHHNIERLAVSEVSETLSFGACFSKIRFENVFSLPSPCVGTSVRLAESVVLD